METVRRGRRWTLTAWWTIISKMCIRDSLIKRLGGQVIEIAPDSPHHINPMDIDLSFDEENPMALKADFILSLMELIVGGKDGLQPCLLYTSHRFSQRKHSPDRYRHEVSASLSGGNLRADQ